MKTHVFIVVMLVFASVFIIVPLEKRSVSAGWYGSGYTYRVQITIDHTKVENHLVNFTMLFNYTSTGFKNHAQADGDDFVFCLNSTGAKLNHEIEAYDSATGYLRAWVNVTGINHVSDVVIDLYYGNATTTSNQNMHGTWDRSYVMVQHLDDGIIWGADSTKNHENMTVYRTAATSSGKIGTAQVYDADADKIYTNTTLTAMATPTYECWVKFSSDDGGTADIIMAQPTNDPSIFRYTNESIDVYEDGAEMGWTAGYSWPDTNWHYVLLVFDGTNGNVYVDKVKVRTKLATTLTAAVYMYYLGDNRIGTDTFRGTIDEARVSNVGRNWSWVNTSYNNMNSPSTFYSVGPQNIIDPVTPSAPVYFEALSQNNTWIKLNWTHGATGVDKTVIRANQGSYPSLSVGSTIYNGTLHGYNHTGLTKNTHWFYRCYAWNSTGAGTYNSTSLRSHDTTMNITTNSIITQCGTTGPNSITIDWTAIHGADKYVLLYREDQQYPVLNGLPAGTIAYNGTAFTTEASFDTNLNVNTHYYFSLYTWNTTNGFNYTASNDHDTTYGYTIKNVHYINHNSTSNVTYDIYDEELGAGSGYVLNVTSVGYNPFINTILHNATNNYTKKTDIAWIENISSELPIACNDGDWSNSGAVSGNNYVVYNRSNVSIFDKYTIKDNVGWHNLTINKTWFDFDSGSLYFNIRISSDEFDNYLIYLLIDDTHTSSITLLTNNVGSTNLLNEQEILGYRWIINSTSESQLNLTFNLTHAVETHFAVWNTPFWDIIVNATGNTSGLVVVDNSVNTTGTNEYQWRPLLGVNGEWWVWVNQTGDLTPLQKFENIISAYGNHTLVQNGTGYYIWANYTGSVSSGTGFNLSVINPNPANTTTIYDTNFLKKDAGGLTTSVDVQYNNFTTPPAPFPGTYNMTVNSTLFTNTPATWNTSTVYASVWNNATGGIAANAYLYVGQMMAFPDYTTYRSYLLFNTSSLPDEAEIDDAYVQLTIEADFSDTDFNVTLQNVKPPKPHNPLIPSDYSKAGVAGHMGLENTSGYVAEDLFNITIKPSGLADINHTGITRWALRSNKDINATSPNIGDNEWIIFYGNGMPVAKCPKLFINYTIPAHNWVHYVNLTWYSNSSGAWLPYYYSNVNSNGTVTVPAVNFSGVSSYWWNVSYNSNHTNYGNSTVWNFETVATSGGSSSGGGGSRVTSYLLIGLCFGGVGGALLWGKKQKRRKP